MVTKEKRSAYYVSKSLLLSSIHIIRCLMFIQHHFKLNIIILKSMIKEYSQCFRHKEDLWDHHQDHLERGDRVKVPNLDHLSSPPPSFVPAQTQQQQVGTFAVDPGSIRGCLFRYTYVWLNNRQQFWYYPTFVGRTSISGWRWTGFNWVFFGVDLRQIQSFTCV